MVRPAELRDAGVMADIVAGQPLWERYGYTRDQVSTDLEDAISGHGLLLVAETTAGILGWAWWQRRAGFGVSPYLRLIAVARGAEGRGVGTSLLADSERRLKSSAKGLFLLVSDFNEAAQRFYESRGYQQVGRLPGFVIEDVAELIYWKPSAVHRVLRLPKG